MQATDVSVNLARGESRRGLSDSPAMQQTSSYPRYPKNEDVAPRRTPVTPNGTMGVRFEESKKQNPPMIMNKDQK